MATIAPMAVVLGDRSIHPFTVEDVLRMLDVGILPEDNRLDLLHGMLTEEDLEYLHDTPLAHFS